MIKLSKDQKLVQDDLIDWYKGGFSQYITLGGYAGTGKTTLIASIRKKLHKENKKPDNTHKKKLINTTLITQQE